MISDIGITPFLIYVVVVVCPALSNSSRTPDSLSGS